MRAARDAGINFLDDARYNDETGSAPIPTGYSEVLFGELFRSAGWKRDETIVSNKLWWEFWPEQDAAAEIDGSLGRMGFDYIDVIYANPPPEHGLSLDEMVGSVNDLITTGRARAWAIVNWPAAQLLEAAALRARLGAPQPCAAQLPYSLVRARLGGGAEMKEALAACGAPVVASYVAGGRRADGQVRRRPELRAAPPASSTSRCTPPLVVRASGCRSWRDASAPLPRRSPSRSLLGNPDVATGAVRSDTRRSTSQRTSPGSRRGPTSATPIGASWQPSVADRQYL